MLTSSVLAVVLVLAAAVPDGPKEVHVAKPAGGQTLAGWIELVGQSVNRARLEREIDLLQLFRLMAEATQGVAEIRQQISDRAERLIRTAVEAQRAQLEFGLMAEKAALDIARVRHQAIRIILSTAPMNSAAFFWIAL